MTTSSINDSADHTAAASGPDSASAHKSGTTGATTARLVERAVLMQVGAGLVVRDDIVSSLRKMSRKYGTSDGLEKQLNRYEKRGIRTRNRLERQIKRQRNQFERDIRARRKRLEDHAFTLGRRFEAAGSVGKRLEGPANAVTSRVEGLTGKIEELLGSTHNRNS